MLIYLYMFVIISIYLCIYIHIFAHVDVVLLISRQIYLHNCVCICVYIQTSICIHSYIDLHFGSPVLEAIRPNICDLGAQRYIYIYIDVHMSIYNDISILNICLL